MLIQDKIKLLNTKSSLKGSNLEKNKSRHNKEINLYGNHKGLIKISVIIYIISIHLFIQTKSNENINCKLNSQYSYITLKINKKGKYSVFRSVKQPDEIYINEVNQTIINSQYDFNKTNNTIKLVWLNPITSATWWISMSDSQIEEIDLSNFDASKITSMSGMFSRCKSLKFVNLTNLNAPIVEDMSSMFANCENLEYINISNINIPKIKKMNKMFIYCYALKELDLSNINIEVATEMNYMFDSCRALTFLNFSNFNVLVKSMTYMFNNCQKLESLNLSSFNTSQVINMEGIFYGCYSLINLDISNFDISRVTNMEKIFCGCNSLINLDISSFDTSKVTNMKNMFCCSKLNTLDISKFNTSQVTSFRGMFICRSLVSLNVSHFDTSKATDIGEMFKSCESLTSLNISNFDTSQVESMDYLFSYCYNLSYLDLYNFDTKKVKTMEGLFCGCYKLYSINLSSFDTSKVENMGLMFSSCYNLTYLNISHFNTLQVTNMAYMFNRFYNFDIIDLSIFNTSKVVDMRGLFMNCYTLTSLNISHFDTSNVADMSHMFDGCVNMTSFDLSNFKTSNLKNMAYMFNNCPIITSLDLSNFNTSLVSNMGYMFYNCINLTSLDLTKFNTSLVTNMGYMFYNCTNLTSLDLTKFNTSLVSNMGYMFYNCKNLIHLNISSFKPQITNLDYMFYNCTNLTSIDLSNFDATKVNYMNYMFYNCHSLISLNLSKFSSNSIYPYPILPISGTFRLCSSLQFINLENFDKRDFYIQTFTTNIIICSNYYSWGNVIFYGKNLTINCIEDEINNKEKRCFNNYEITINNNKFVCKVCGDNYYQIYKDINNNRTYSNCYNKVNGYYLNKENNLIFKPCYLSCKTCDKEGNESYHNCIECKEGYISDLKYDNYSNCYNASEKSIELVIDNITYLTDTLYESNTEIKIGNNIVNLSNDNIYESQIKTELNNITENISYLLINSYSSDEEININNSTEETNYVNTSEYIELNNTQFIYSYNNNQSEIIESNSIKGIFKEDKSEMINNYNNYNLNTNKINITQNNIIEKDPIHIFNKSEYIEKLKTNLINKLKIQNNTFTHDLEEEFENILLTLSTTKLQKNNKNKNKTSIDLGECENRLKFFYNIPKENPLYIIKLDINEEGINIPKIEYEVYYPFNSNFNNFTKLNLSICEGTKIEISIPVSIKDDINKYNISSDYYNDICSLATSENGTDITLSDRRKEFIDNNMTLCEENCELIDYNYTKEKAICSCDVKINMPLVEKVKFDKKKLFDNFIKVKNIININVVKCYKKVFNINNIKKNKGFYIIIAIMSLYLITLLIFRYRSFYKLERNLNKFIISHNSPKELKGNNKNNETQKNNLILQLNDNRNIEIFKNSRNLNKINLNFKSDKEQKRKDNNNNINNLESKNENTLIKNKMNYKDFELNILDYKKAIKYDKRNYIQYYLSLLKYNHLLVFSFFNIRDYNSLIIKIFLFFFFFTTYFAVNALFFTDQTMHKIYEDNGTFNFIYHFPIIIYSSLISGIINAIIKQFALSQKNMIEFTHIKKKENLEEKAKNTLKKLKIKFILFFIISFIFLLFLGYYIICFCGIYSNTQIILIKDTLISFALSMVYPF